MLSLRWETHNGPSKSDEPSGRCELFVGPFLKPGIQRVVFREAKTYHVAGYAGPVWYIGSYPHVGLQRY